MAEQLTFTDEDVRNLKLLGEFLKVKGKFTVDIPDVVDFYKLLVWYNNHTIKVNDHIMELKRVITEPKPEETAAKAEE